tara:strand:+ start:379 stop:630 length:252 start_codon:yes stop_codon:yes gene_type:complete
MSDYTPEDIVKYSLSGDGARAKEAIQGVLASKVMDSLEAKKAEVAQAMFNGVSDGAMGLDKPEVADPSPRTETDIPKTGTTEA